MPVAPAPAHPHSTLLPLFQSYLRASANTRFFFLPIYPWLPAILLYFLLLLAPCPCVQRFTSHLPQLFNHTPLCFCRFLHVSRRFLHHPQQPLNSRSQFWVILQPFFQIILISRTLIYPL